MIGLEDVIGGMIGGGLFVHSAYLLGRLRRRRIADVRRLTLGPGDAIAVKLSESVTPEVADIIRGDLRKAMVDPDLPVLICDPSVDVEIVGRRGAGRPPVRPGGNLE